MSGGVDSSVAAAVLRDQGHDVTGRHAQALGRRERLRLLLGVRRRGRPPGRRAARHPALRLQLRRGVRRQGRRAVRRRVRRGPDTEPVHRVQPVHEVGPAARPGGVDGLRLPSPPVTTRASRRAHRRCADSDAARMRPRISRTCSPCSTSTNSRSTLLPVGEMTKAEVRAHGCTARAAHRDQGREHGRVLHHPRRADASSSTRAFPPRRARSSTPTARCVGDARRRARVHGRPAARARGGDRRAAVRRGRRRRDRDRHPRDAPRSCCAKRVDVERVDRRPTARSRSGPRSCVQVRAHGEPYMPGLWHGDRVEWRTPAAPRRPGPDRRALRTATACSAPASPAEPALDPRSSGQARRTGIRRAAARSSSRGARARGHEHQVGPHARRPARVPAA